MQARHNDDKVRYSEAKEFCELKNETLPRTSFRVIEKGHEHRSIFWLLEDEETRKAAQEENRQKLR